MANPTLFILSLARSGSTLLRLAMNAHPQVISPPEMHLLMLAKRQLWTERAILGLQSADPWQPAIDATRTAMSGLLGKLKARYPEKSTVCEKSITSVNHLDVLNEIFPDAGLIFLYRHPLDLVQSALNAIAHSPHGYDFDAHLARFVDPREALLNYWLDKTAHLMQYESTLKQPGNQRTVRVAFEDLVSQPDHELTAIGQTFDLVPFPDWSSHVHSSDRDEGPGDQSAYDRDGFDPATAGKGRQMGLNGLSRNLLKRVARQAQSLGYDINPAS